MDGRGRALSEVCVVAVAVTYSWVLIALRSRSYPPPFIVRGRGVVPGLRPVLAEVPDLRTSRLACPNKRPVYR